MRRNAGAVAGLVASLALLVAVPVAASRLSSGAAGDRASGFSSPVSTAATAAPTPPAARTTGRTPGSTTTTAAARDVAPALPVRLLVPQVGVDAPVDQVGVDRAGLMALPRDARRVGWYRFGAAPGALQGSAVLAGHRDSRTQGRGVLWDLGRVEEGQSLQLALADGRRLTYDVVSVDRTAKAALALDALFARDGAPLLRLVTCGGDYIRDRGGYQDNIVVTARPRGAA